MSRAALPTVIVAATLLLGAAPAWASSYILDTGPGVASTGCGLCLHSDQITAVGFVLNEASVITSIESNFYNGGVDPASVTLWLYKDEGALADVGGLGPVPLPEQPWTGASEVLGTPLHSGSFNVESSCCWSGWTGLTGLDWALDGGFYWVVFASALDVVAQNGNPIPDPISRRGLLRNGAIDWRVLDGDSSLALRIGAAEAAPVPEPASLLLVAAGIGGLVVRRRFRARVSRV